MIIYSESDVIELRKCIDSPAHFIEQYCFVQHPTCGAVRMALNDHQREWLKSAEENRVTELGDDRQNGKTQLIAAYALWTATFKHDHNVSVLAGKFVLVKEIRLRIAYMHRMLPDLLKAKLVCDNLHLMAFGNGSKIRFGAITETAGKGLSINTLLIDSWDQAKSDVLECFLTSICPCITSDFKLITTGNDPWQLLASS